MIGFRLLRLPGPLALQILAVSLGSHPAAPAAEPCASNPPAADTRQRLTELDRAIAEAAESGDAERLPGLIDEAAAIDLREALGFAHAHQIDGALTAGSWRPPDGAVPDAFATAITSPESAYRDHLVLGLISAWVKSDAAAARRAIDALPPTPYRTELVDHHNGAMVRFRPAEALAAAVRGSGQPQAIKFRDAALALVRTDLDAAAAWIEMVPSDLPGARDTLTRAVAKAMAERDTPKAGAWVPNLKSTDDLAAASEEVAYTWAGSDPDAAAKWALALEPGRVRDAALRALVFRCSPSTPDQAFAWALHIENPGLREIALATAASEWTAKDPAAARAAIGSAPVSDATRAALLEAIGAQSIR
jgi:hypothetical protein